MKAAPENYFTFSDCPSVCTLQNISCIIYESNGVFKDECLSSNLSCIRESSARTVCLRPELSPIGGESIWSKYKEQRETNSTTPPQCDMRSQIPLIVSASLNAFFVASLFIGLATLVYIRNKRETYENIPSSPSPSHQTDSYQVVV